MATDPTSRPKGKRRAVPRQQRSIDRWTSILDAAERVFEREGFDNATTVQVADEAGISVGTLYHYVADKYALADALSDRYLDELVALAETLVVDDRDQPTPDLLRQILSGLAAVAAANTGFGNLLRVTEEGAPAEGRNRLVAAFHAQAAAVISARTESVDPDDLSRTAAVCVSVVVSMVEQLAVTPIDRQPAVIDEYVYLLTGYLAARFPGPDDPVWDDPDPVIPPVGRSNNAGGDRVVLSPNRQVTG